MKKFIYNEQMEDELNVEEIAERLNCSVAKIHYYIQRNIEIQKLFIIRKKKYNNRNKSTYQFYVLKECNIEKLKDLISLGLGGVNKAWNKSAIECFKNNMNCKNCTSANKLACMQFVTPPIKEYVRKIKRKYGVPNVTE